MKLALIKPERIEKENPYSRQWETLTVGSDPLFVAGERGRCHLSDLLEDDISLATDDDLKNLKKLVSQGIVRYEFFHEGAEYGIEARLELHSRVAFPEDGRLFKKGEKEKRRLLERIFPHATQGRRDDLLTSIETDDGGSHLIKASLATMSRDNRFPWLGEEEFLERMSRFISRLEGAYNALHETINKAQSLGKTFVVEKEGHFFISSATVSEKNGVRIITLEKDVAREYAEGIRAGRERDRTASSVNPVREETTRQNPRPTTSKGMPGDRSKQNTPSTMEDRMDKRGARSGGPHLKDIAGCDEAKERLKTVIDYLQDPTSFLLSGSAPPKGMLLHGPPGTGKTSLAKALANETDAYFKEIRGSSFKNRYYGDTEERLEQFLKEIASRDEYTILFIDEAEHLLPSEGNHSNTADDAIVSRFRTFIDGMQTVKNAFVMLATNHPERIDEAVRDRLLKVHIDLPDLDARMKIIEYHMRHAYEEGKTELERRGLDRAGYRWMYDQSFSPRAIAERSEGVNGRTLNYANRDSLEYRRQKLAENPDYLITTELFLEKLKRLRESKNPERKRNIPGFGE